MDSAKMFKWHILDFWACGLWPSKTRSSFYTCYSILISMFAFVLYPISSLVCVFFMNTVDAIVDNLVLTSSLILVSMKALNLLIHQQKLVEILCILKKLDKTISPQEYQLIFASIFKRSNVLFFCFFGNFIMCYVTVLLLVLVSDPGHRTWSSTYLYPIEILHHRIIYFGGVVIQGISNLLQVVVDVSFDTYGASLMDLASGHIKLLGKRLSVLGTNKESLYQQKLKLIDLCEKYILILK